MDRLHSRLKIQTSAAGRIEGGTDMGKQTRPVRPTRKQKAEMQAWKLKPSSWLVVLDTDSEMVLISKSGLKKRVIRRGA